MGANNADFNGGLSLSQKEAINRYANSLDNKTKVKEIATSLVTNSTTTASEEEVGLVRNLLGAIKTHSVVPPDDSRESLVSGVNHRGNLPKIGDVVTHSISSATTDDRIAQRFATSGPHKPVIYHYSHKTPRLPIQGIAMFADEKEHLVSGSFKVWERSKQNGINHIYLKPVENNGS
jgi:hypothetical protein